LGEAISFVALGDFKNLCAIESRLNHVIERKDIAEFPIRKVVPISILNYVRTSKPPQSKSAPRSKAAFNANDKAAKKAPSNTPEKGPEKSPDKGPETRKNKHIWG